jgi:hypothetical protein
MKFSITVKMKLLNKDVCESIDAPTFLSKININAVFGNDILSGQWHAYTISLKAELQTLSCKPKGIFCKKIPAYSSYKKNEWKGE